MRPPVLSCYYSFRKATPKVIELTLADPVDPRLTCISRFVDPEKVCVVNPSVHGSASGPLFA
jgi:hypothetical protein